MRLALLKRTATFATCHAALEAPKTGSLEATLRKQGADPLQPAVLDKEIDREISVCYLCKTGVLHFNNKGPSSPTEALSHLGEASPAQCPLLCAKHPQRQGIEGTCAPQAGLPLRSRHTASRLLGSRTLHSSAGAAPLCTSGRHIAGLHSCSSSAILRPGLH